jgi:phage terminase large subunit-like protein
LPLRGGRIRLKKTPPPHFARSPSPGNPGEDDYAREIEEQLREAARRCGSDERLWRHFLRGLAPPVLRGLIELWSWQAHGGQREPGGDWIAWLLMAGRGFGKTRAGAEWISARARDTRGARIALVGSSREDVVKVMIEGPSGLLRVARVGEDVVWRPSLGTVRFGNGAEAFVYSAEAPEALRGPEHHFAWADELAKWGRPSRFGRAGPGSSRADSAWDNLTMGLRLGERPRCVVTTTPRPVALLKRVVALPGTVVTRGRTEENVHLPDAFVSHMVETYGGTRLGAQELDGELIERVEGSLWPRELIERCRVPPWTPPGIAGE